MASRLFWDTETEQIYTIEDIEKFRQVSIADGDTFMTDTIEAYLRNCLDKNGSLEEIKVVKSVYIGNKLVYSETNIKSDLF